MTIMNLFCVDEETSQHATVTVDFPVTVGADEFRIMLEYCAVCKLAPINFNRLKEFIDRIRFADDNTSGVCKNVNKDDPLDVIYNVYVTPDDLSFLLTCSAELIKCLFSELMEKEIAQPFHFTR